MVSKERRAEIRRLYRTLRINVDKTQLEVEALARLDSSRYWKIENGVVFPTTDERAKLARILKVSESDLPSADGDKEPSEAVAS